MPLSALRVLRAFRYALYFDGVDDYVSLPSAVRQYGAHTIEVWVYPVIWKAHDGLFGGFGLGASTSRGGIALTRYAGDNRLYYDIYTSTTRYAVSSPVPSAGLWTHVTALYDGNVMALYYNTELRTSRTIGGITIDWSGITRTEIAYSGWAYFNGYVSVFRIYSRALTGSEIRWNYVNPDNPIRNGLVIWLHIRPDYIEDIDGDGVLEWIDLSGFNNHGKIYGARLVELIKTPTRTLPVARAIPVTR